MEDLCISIIGFRCGGRRGFGVPSSVLQPFLVYLLIFCSFVFKFHLIDINVHNDEMEPASNPNSSQYYAAVQVQRIK